MAERPTPAAAAPDAPRAAPTAAAWSGRRWLSPVSVTAVVLAVYLGLVLARAQGDPLAFARLGDGFAGGVPVGEPGYDGQFAYWIAMDPRPAAAAARLDVPAYRYQRILYPLLARALAAGQAEAIPWALLAVNYAAQVAGTWAVARWLRGAGVSGWYALPYGLWVGLVMAARLDLTEPLCYALAAGALLAHARGRMVWSAALLGLAVFAKETALVFLAAMLAWAAWHRQGRALAGYAAAASVFAAFQAALYAWFGQIGLASGGYMATPFEVVPYLGLARVATASIPAFVLLLAIFGPLVIFPSLWGLAAAGGRVLRGDWAAPVLALAGNAALIAAAPYSTMREPLGLARLATGLVLSMLLFGAHTRSRRALNYALFWVAALALAVNE
jgi:hypothetical protein